jgi:hypothetical protein
MAQFQRQRERICRRCDTPQCHDRVALTPLLKAPLDET